MRTYITARASGTRAPPLLFLHGYEIKWCGNLGLGTRLPGGHIECAVEWQSVSHRLFRKGLESLVYAEML